MRAFAALRKSANGPSRRARRTLALYPAIKRSESRASSVVRHSPTNCDQPKLGRASSEGIPSWFGTVDMSALR
jgi:hypothetical protein